MGNERHKVVAGEICGNELSHIREAVCVLTEKVYDSCRSKECIEDAPVIFRDSRYIRWLIRHAINVKVRRAVVCNVYSDIEPVPFKRGFYTVDVKFFIRVHLDFFLPDCHNSCGTRIFPAKGLVVFDMKTILFGSEGGVKIFSSHFVENGPDIQRGSRLVQDNLPSAKIEVAEPIALNAKIVDLVMDHDCDHHDVHPDDVNAMLGDDDDPVEVADDRDDDDDRHEPRRRVVEVTLGLFTIIKLVRLVQLLIPAFDFCVPAKNCVISSEENPCELFETIEFPVEEFSPPQFFDFPGAAEEERILRREGREERRDDRRDDRDR